MFDDLLADIRAKRERISPEDEQPQKQQHPISSIHPSFSPSSPPPSPPIGLVVPSVPDPPLGPNPQCGHWNGRDYRQHPIFSNVRSESPQVLRSCDVPCVWNRDAHMKIVDIGRGSCGHSFSFVQSMEAVYGNSFVNEDRSRIVSNCHLDSDVPAPYFSWVEYGFMEPLRPKTQQSLVAAWISNCGARSGRLDYLQRLMAAGVTVDSYGACMNNKPNPLGKQNWFKSKIEALQSYKFAIAFENTMLTDYVTEKLFMAFIAGSVPIHLGIKDVHKFGPSPHSIISVHDFPSPEDLAKYLLFLDSHPEEYKKYLDWKWKGYSPEFQAMIDLSDSHSTCRACIEAADRYRSDFGDPHPSVRPFPLDDPDFRPFGADLWVKIRPRNKFWFHRLWLPKAPSLEVLFLSVAALYKLEYPSVLFGIQTRERPHRYITTQKDLDTILLTPQVELEAVIIVRPDFSNLVEPTNWLPTK